MTVRFIRYLSTAAILVGILAIPCSAQEGQSDSDLAKKTQNPVSDLISLPFQNNTNFDFGPGDDILNVLNIQPVIPVKIGNWNLINRPILPVIYQPELVPGTGSEFGIGDLNYQLFFSPAAPSKFIWGVGPSLLVPTATDDRLGTEKWAIGPSFVGLTMKGKWVVGAIVQNIWSFAGEDSREDVNQFLLQYFINYNLKKGKYLTTAPIITANWEAPSSERWIVPFGLGFGKITRFGKRPVNLSAHAYYNVESPTIGPDWQIRLQLALLFPKKKP